MPMPVEALPCGSRSISSTRCPVAAKAVARLIAVVVLPTPPFWFATAIRIMRASAPGPAAAHPGRDDDSGIGVGEARLETKLSLPCLPRRFQFGLRAAP